jgi:hypothetical protein
MSAPNNDDLYGKIRIARLRENGSCFQDWEVGHSPVSLFKLDETTALQMAEALNLAKQAPFGLALTTIGYVWVMDAKQTVWISVEELALADGIKRRGIPKRRFGQHPALEKKLGHPTLIAGGQARIAGELAIEEISGRFRWVINCSSGRYCYDEALRPKVHQLINIVGLFKRFGVAVMPDFDDAA